MNKYQDALNKIVKSCCPNCVDENGCSSCDIKKICNATAKDWVNRLQELVDKETPKKVVLHYKHHLGTAWGRFVSRITCPSCNRRLKDKIPNNQLFCPKCGQKLKWSEENE